MRERERERQRERETERDRERHTHTLRARVPACETRTARDRFVPKIVAFKLAPAVDKSN